MTDIRTLTFVIPKDASVSNSIDGQHLSLIALDIPALEATTTQLEIQHTAALPSVLDADATWKPIYDKGTSLLRVTVIAGTPRFSYLSPGPDGLRLGRIRLRAATDAGVAVSQATALRTILPHFYEV
jgi:hypothetical protein